MKLYRSSLFVALALALIAPAPRAGIAAPPDGQVTFAIHVSLAPTWFDPAETPGVITPFMTLYALHGDPVTAEDVSSPSSYKGASASILTARMAELPTIAGHPYVSPYEDLKIKGR